jgi:NADPH:quinone reductase-like Zn-dependent oxidoreductase
VGKQRLCRLRRALTPARTLVLNAGGSPSRVIGAMGPVLREAAVNGFIRQRLRIPPTRQDRAELATLTALIGDRKLTPILDRTYPLAGTAEGLRQVATGRARGKVVITVT